MVIFAVCFTLGVWLLQQQAALPDLVRAWPLIGIPFALLIPENTRWLRFARMLFVAVFALGLGFFHAAWQAEQRLAISLPDEWQGRDIEVVGVVAELPRSHERGQRFRFDVERVLTPQASVPHRVYLSTYLANWNKKIQTPFGLSLSKPASIHPSTGSGRTDFNFEQAGDVSEPVVVKAGERWQFTLRLKQPHGSSNPHGFDFEVWALENNTRATGYVHNKGNNLRLDKLADGIGYRIETWREAVRDKFNKTLAGQPYAGVLSALAVGDQDSIPAAQWKVYTRTGVNHLMSISGLHITMLASLGFALTYWLWRRSTWLMLRIPARKAAALMALLVALGYALLSGFGVPAQRTVYMVGAVAVALLLNRNFSLGQIMSIALLGVLIPDPWAVLSPGFWLSFGAVALILYVSAYRLSTMNGHAGGKGIGRAAMRIVHEYASVQWAMTIGLTPLLLGLFQQVSLVSPIANALAIPLVSLVVVPLALLGAVLPLDAPLWLAHGVMRGVMYFLEWLSAMPQAVWLQHAPPAWSIVAGMLGVLLILAPRGFPARWLGLLLLLPMFLNKPALPEHGTARLVVFDVGQGLAVVVQTASHALLYDTGPDFSGDADSGNRILIPAMKGLGIAKLDGLILSHDDIDHTGGAASVMQLMPVSWVSSSLITTHPLLNNTLPQQAEEAVRESRRCRDGDHWEWDGIRFELLHPASAGDSAKKSHDNNQSCVLRISAGDRHILLAADIEKQSEQRLLREHADKLATDLLVVPHHGSKSSSSDGFVAATQPDYAVFTVGYRNRFGHPKQEVLQRYSDNGAELLRSDEDGAILVEMNGQGVTVESYRKTHRRYWTHIPSP
jgi:competence protein ComEC